MIEMYRVSSSRSNPTDRATERAIEPVRANVSLDGRFLLFLRRKVTDEKGTQIKILSSFFFSTLICYTRRNIRRMTVEDDELDEDRLPSLDEA